MDFGQAIAESSGHFEYFGMKVVEIELIAGAIRHGTECRRLRRMALGNAKKLLDHEPT